MITPQSWGHGNPASPRREVRGGAGEKTLMARAEPGRADPQGEAEGGKRSPVNPAREGGVAGGPDANPGCARGDEGEKVVGRGPGPTAATIGTEAQE